MGVSSVPAELAGTSPEVLAQERLAPPFSEGTTMLAMGRGVSPAGDHRTPLLPVLHALEAQPWWMIGIRSSFSRVAIAACIFRNASFAAVASSRQLSNREPPSSLKFGVLGVDGHAVPWPCSARLSTRSETCRKWSRSAVTCTNSRSAASSRARSIGVGRSSIVGVVSFMRPPMRDGVNERPVAFGDPLAGLSEWPSANASHAKLVA